MTAIEPVLGTVYRVDTTDPPDLGAATFDIVNNLAVRGVGFQATETTRDTAYAPMIAGTAPYTSPKTGMRCYVQFPSQGTYPDICTWTGSEWVYDHPVPILYQWTFGQSGPLNNTAMAGYAPYNLAFVPTRSGYATVGAHVDMQTVGKGWLSAYARVRNVDGTQFPGAQIWVVGKEPAVTFAGIPTEWRQEGDFVNRLPVRLVKGVQLNFAVEVAASYGGGSSSWQFNSFQWEIVQS